MIDGLGKNIVNKIMPGDWQYYELSEIILVIAIIIIIYQISHTVHHLSCAKLSMKWNRNHLN